ncbi:MAG: glycosyltransferase family 2 protein [Bacteroidales bacterium]|nr:glycosyltransferase family 2 protein [Bacteroidales bacterium]
MLSILIPTYNYDCRCLVSDLHQQAQQAGIAYEIIVADDASPEPIYKEKNREINTLLHCRLIELPENVGRARIRNRLADEAQYEWLLFMDCDAEVISPTFITDYLRHTDAEVICGGLCHSDVLPSPTVSLRYAYEKRADKRRAARYRERKPYEQFTPFNFCIRRDTFQAIRFDESIHEYGHEDTLFGIELQRRQAQIRHIDNPLRHTGLEENQVFLEKTRAALRNLATMESILQGHSSLLSAYGLLKKFKLHRLAAHWFTQHEQQLTLQLTSSLPRLTNFNLYKLGYYCSLMKK